MDPQENGQRNPDRHKDRSIVIAVRLSYDEVRILKHLIANSPLPHEAIGGYLKWLIRTQALRKR